MIPSKDTFSSCTRCQLHIGYEKMTGKRPREPFVEGTRVDCLFEDEYFRGTIEDASYYNGQHHQLFRVCFDDGDVRDDVPEEDMELPLEQNSRVQCLFEVRS